MPVRWSRVKSRVRALLAGAVKDRVDFHSTRYRRAHDSDGRAWITLDGEEVLNMATIVAWRTQYDMAYRMKEAFNGDSMAFNAGWDYAKEYMRDESIFWQHEFGQALFKYPNLPIDEILSSPNPLIRAIGVLDRRVGRARLIGLLKDEPHPLVMRLGAFRSVAEDWQA